MLQPADRHRNRKSLFTYQQKMLRGIFVGGMRPGPVEMLYRSAGKVTEASKYVRVFTAWDEFERPTGEEFTPPPGAENALAEFVRRYHQRRISEALFLSEVALWKPRAAGRILTLDEIRSVWRDWQAETSLRDCVMNDDSAMVVRYPWQRLRIRLDERLVQFYRRPRSKRRRIVKKWRKRPENWRPHPCIFGETLAVGREVMVHGYGRSSGDVSGRPLMWIAHPQTWERYCRLEPSLRSMEVAGFFEAGGRGRGRSGGAGACLVSGGAGSSFRGGNNDDIGAVGETVKGLHCGGGSFCRFGLGRNRGSGSVRA